MLLRYIRLVLFLFPSASLGADILAIIPTPSYSHQTAYAQLWRELSLRGHNVTLITTDPQNDLELKNLTEIDVSWTYEYLKDISQMAENVANMWNGQTLFYNISINISRGQLSTPQVQDLIRGSNKGFDVVIIECNFPEFLAFGKIYKCPTIVVSSLPTCDSFESILGNPTHRVLYPHFLAPFYPPLNFSERVIAIIHSWYIWYKHVYHYIPIREDILHQFFDRSLSLNTLLNNVDAVFVMSNAAIQIPRPLVPLVIEIGYRRTVSPKPWPDDLKEFLDNATTGFVYFSLGSNVKSRQLGQHTLNSIIGALEEIPYKVLWKFESDTLLGKPRNVKLVKWAPQLQVLAHPNIKLFVTQGGLQSMEEGIYSEVPFVVIPFFADQEQNAHLLRSKGVAKIVGRKPFIKKEDLRNAIMEVIQNSSYRTEVRKLKRLALDVPMSGLEKAVWWTEYVIRNKGAKHLRSPARDIPTYQYYLLDVIGFMIVTIILIVWGTVGLLKFLIRLFNKYVYWNAIKLKEQ